MTSPAAGSTGTAPSGIANLTQQDLGSLYQYIQGRLPQPKSSTVTAATSFPTTTTDGTSAILTDSLTAPTYWWTFTYNAAVTAWLFTGGAPLVVSGVGGTAVAVFTLPNAGQWLLRGITYGPSTGSTSGETLTADLLVAASVVQSHPVQSENGAGGTSGLAVSGWDVQVAAGAGDAVTVTTGQHLGGTPAWTVEILPVALT